MLRHALHEIRTGYKLIHLQTWLQDPLFASKHGSRVRADAAAMVRQPVARLPCNFGAATCRGLVNEPGSLVCFMPAQIEACFVASLQKTPVR